MQVSAGEREQQDTHVSLRVRISPSEKRRLDRMVRLSDGGSVQRFIYEALMRAITEQEDRLLPYLSGLLTASEQPAWVNVGPSGEG